MALYVGTSGWSYPEWAERFYAGVPRREWLAHYAGRFCAVEVDASFYHTPRPTTLARWRNETPAEFRFALKGHRYLTHVRRLRDVTEPLARERANAAALGEKLRVMLWQLPAGLARDPARLEAFANALGGWPEVRHAIEFRHPSWFEDGTAGCLERHRIACCQSDAARWPLWEAVTTDLVFVRLHGRPRTYSSSYGEEALDRWARNLLAWTAEGREVHVYFDNTDAGHAPADALRLLGRLRAMAPGAQGPAAGDSGGRGSTR